MRKEQNIIETLDKISIIKKELDGITALRNEAFKVFEDFHTCTLPIPKMLEIRDTYWKPLYNWNFLNTYSGYIELQSWSKIHSTFDLLYSGKINRSDFSFALTSSRLGVERYIQSLKALLSAEQEYFYHLIFIHLLSS